MISRKVIVQKFGGSSLSNYTKIRRVAAKIADTVAKGYQVAVVVSAMGKLTDRLIGMARSLSAQPDNRELDMLLVTGEQASCALMSIALNEMGTRAISFTGHQVGIFTDSIHTKARVLGINNSRILEYFSKGYVVIIAGFQGVDINSNYTTLGRGGSDITALALAASLNAKVVEKFTDEEGVYTADPKIVKGARKLLNITYDEMLEMSSAGAKILHPRAVFFAKKYNIKIHVRSSLTDKTGTIISQEGGKMENPIITGVTTDSKVAKITIYNVPDKPGLAYEIFGELAENEIPIDMIVQSSTRDATNNISFTLENADLNVALKILNKFSEKYGCEIVCDKNIAKISIIGGGIKSNAAVASAMFGSLSKAGINIDMISTSEIKVSCVISKDRLDEAVQAVSGVFSLGDGV